MRLKIGRLVIMIALSVSASVLFNVRIAPAANTTAGSLAASMQPGTWAELTTSNISATLAKTGGSSNVILAYADTAVWDPASQRFFFVGGDHGPSSSCPRFVSFTESTNTWQILQEVGSWSTSWSPCGTTPMHGYNHTAIDTSRGKLYHRPFGDAVVRKYDIASKTWSDLPAVPNSVMGYSQCCVGVAWFPERNSLIYASIESGTNGALAEYSETTGQWRRIAGNLPMGAYQNFAKYNPVQQVVLFGGGEGDRHIYKLDSAGQVTALKDAPIPVGIMESVVTVDPVTGKYLIFGNSNDFYVYDVTSDNWTLQTGATPPIFSPPVHDPPISGIVVATVSQYGVNMFVKCYRNDCRVYLYKHNS